MVATSRRLGFAHHCADSDSRLADIGSSDDVLIEDIKSGLRAVQTVTEQLSVEEESTILIQLISRVETAVRGLGLSLPKANKKIGRVLHQSRGARSNEETTLTILNDTLQNVQELHIATIQRQVKRSVVTSTALCAPQ
jgi:capsid portal protein